MRRGLGVLACALLVFGSSGSAQAAVCQILTVGSSCESGGLGGALFQMDEQPTGSGVIDPFLRIGGARTTTLDEAPLVESNGTLSREFLLDVNGPIGSTKSLLSMDELQIFLSPDGTPGGPSTGDNTAGAGSLAGLTAVYDLDTGDSNMVKMDYSLIGGSGSGDLIVFIPSSLFTLNGSPAPSSTYVYQYSLSGNKKPCCQAGDGFEEWWIRLGDGGGAANPETPIPEPGTLLLVGGGLLILARNLRRRTRRTSVGN